MSIPYVDAHTHIDHYTDTELADIRRAVTEMPLQGWAVTIDFESWEKAQQLAADRPDLLVTFGIHPWEADRYLERLDELDEKLAASAHIGEIGLDFVWVKEAARWPGQIELFDYQLRHAAAHNKIVNLHTKGAEQLIADKLTDHGVARALVHWYSGPMEPLADFIQQGCYFTFGLELLRSEKIAEIARRVPLERLLTETDGPGAGEWLIGERGHPRQIPGLVAQLAAIKEISAQEMRQQIWTNYQTMLASSLS